MRIPHTYKHMETRTHLSSACFIRLSRRSRLYNLMCLTLEYTYVCIIHMYIDVHVYIYAYTSIFESSARFISLADARTQSDGSHSQVYIHIYHTNGYTNTICILFVYYLYTICILFVYYLYTPTPVQRALQFLCQRSCLLNLTCLPLELAVFAR